MKIILAAILVLALALCSSAQPVAPCKIDVAVAVDISGSMGDDATALCSVGGPLTSMLEAQNIDFQITLYPIARPQNPPGCAALNSTGLLIFATANNDFNPACYPAPVPGIDLGGDIESWGFGLGLACKYNPWRSGAIKLVLAASDEAPCEGDTLGAPPGSAASCDSDDTNSVTSTIAILNTFGCSSSILLPYDIPPFNIVANCTIALATTLATATGGVVIRYNSSADLVTSLTNALSDVAAQACNQTPPPCDPIGSVGLDNSCPSSCLCYSGYGSSTATGRCSTKQTTGTYIPFDNLFSKKEHVAAIDQVRTRFDNGNLNLLVSGGAVEKTADNSRVSYISIGLESFNKTGLAAPCHCFVQTTEDINGISSDVWTSNQPWDNIRPCCARSVDPFYVSYDCTLDVVHVDGLVFQGDWRAVPTRGRWNRFPLPLILKFQRQINLTSEINVFTDVDIKAYISFQQYFQSQNRGYIQIDVVTLWPYQLTLNSYFADDVDRFVIDNVSFTSVASAPFNGDITGRGCTSTVGSKCWQTISILLHPTNSTVCNLDNRFVFNFTASCRSAQCPDLTKSQVNTTIQAIIRTENFCPAVEFVFPLNGTLTSWTPGFLQRAQNFIIYRYIIGGTALRTDITQKVCFLADIAVNNQAVGQGYTGQDIKDVYFRKFQLVYNNTAIVLYDDTQTPAICPGFTAVCQASNQIALVIDTLGNSNNFPTIQLYQAGVCFYLTRNDGNLNTPQSPRGLVDPWNLSVEQFYTIEADALVEVVYEDEKKRGIISLESIASTSVVVGTDSAEIQSGAAVLVYSLSFIVAFLALLF